MMSDEGHAQEGTVIAHYGIAVGVRFGSGEEVRLPLRRPQKVVVGDRVERKGEGLRTLPSSGVLRRRDRHGRVRSVAAHLDVLAVVVAPIPESPLGFIDRGIVAARVAELEPWIVVNKNDLSEAADLFEELTRLYGEAARLLFVSAQSGDGLASIGEGLSPARRSVFVGTSGVGKSSLLNALLPDLDLDVGEINEVSGLGRHITSVATLHTLPGGGELIDTPGFRDFGPVAVSSRELAAHFPGFEEALIQPCHFRDCLHLTEPGCAVLAALESGDIETQRHEAYRALLTDLQRAEEAEGH